MKTTKICNCGATECAYNTKSGDCTLNHTALDKEGKCVMFRGCSNSHKEGELMPPSHIE